MRPPRAVKLPPPTEAEVAAQVVAAARLLGLTLQRRNVGGMYNPRGQYVAFGEPGDPDWEGTLPGGSGRRVAIEIKAPGKRPTPIQLARLRELAAAGAVAFWTDCPVRFHRAMTLLIGGGHHVEIDSDGIPWVTDEEDRDDSDR